MGKTAPTSLDAGAFDSSGPVQSAHRGPEYDVMPLFIRERAQMCARDIEAAVYRERVSLTPLQFRHHPERGGEEGWSEVGVGHSWTETENAVWFRGRFTVPESWVGERVALYIDFSDCEPLLYLDSTPVQALDYNHQDVLLHDPAQGGESHAFAIECYAPSRGGTFALKAADLVRVDRNAAALHYDFSVAVALLEVLDENSREGQGLRRALEAAVHALHYTEGPRGDAFYASLPAAREALRLLFFDAFPADERRDPAMLLAGHSHIDLAYLWTIPNTRKKVGRTFASVLRLMDEFPEYHFTQSQPQLYAWAKEDYPELYEQVRARINEGRWEPIGGMWVESDCNIPSGESLIRQFLFGQRFFRREFGVETKVLWLPDVFGYSAALPQIIKGCGLDHFMTTKISWNQFNRFPHDTFRWRGIDGTEVLTHLVTAPDLHVQLQQRYQTYNGMLAPAQVRGAWDEYRQKGINSELLYLFGHGDGGGGPTRRMLETGRRLENLAGMPRCSFGRAEEFFCELEERLEGKRGVPVWVGELYLENHRGTLTSQGRLKRANRKCEILLRNAEVFSSLAWAEGALEEYPREALNGAWEKLLLNQFHDILPGTCIPPAVAQAEESYGQIEAAGNQVLNTALDAIAARVSANADTVVFFNPTDTLRPADVVRVTVPNTFVKSVEFSDENGAPLPSQLLGVSPKGERDFLVLVSEVGALGYQTLGVAKAPGPQEETTVFAETDLLENDFVRVHFDEYGEIESFIHKISEDDEGDGTEETLTEREVIAPGQLGNQLIAYEDRPYAYDCWNIDAYYEDKPYPLRTAGTVESIKVIESGPVRAGIEIRRRFLKSSVTQRVYLYAHSPRLEFVTEVDWQERQMLLKAAFPVAVNATSATYEIQHGVIERPTHRNTSWDQARFEVCAHKWADLSEGDYGVSLLNDCKYGHDIHDNVLRLTLIKSGTHPDPEADKGTHVFTYALLPHTGDWRNETLDEAFALNYPLLSRFVSKPAGKGQAPRDLPRSYALATVNDQGIVIDAIKRAEEGDGIIVRLYEAFNTRGSATLTLGFDVAEAFEVNMVEGDPLPIEVHGGGDIRFDYRPFEVKTFLVLPQR